MAIPYASDEEDNEAAVYIDESDVVGEVVIDEQDLPDADEEDQIDNENEAPEDDAIHVFKGHTDSVYAVACNPVESKLVATGGGDDTIYMWEIGEETPPQQLKEHTDSVSALAFSFDGQLLASGGLDGIVCIWDRRGILKHKLEGPGEDIVWLCWHPRGHIVLAGSQDFSTWLWNAESGAFLTVFNGHNGSVTCGGITPDGKLVCTGSADASLRVWNPRSGECIRTVQGHPYHTEGISCIAFSRDSNLAFTGSSDGNACLVNIQNGKVVGALSGHSGPIEAIALSPSLPLVATGGRDKKLIIWDLQTLSIRFTCDHEDDVVKIIWANSEIIYTATLDGKIQAWDPRTGICQRTFHGHEPGMGVLDMSLTCDGRAIVSVSDDGTARVFEV